MLSGTSGAFDGLPVTVPSRMMQRGAPAQTSPEELLAAAHATCFTMALGSTLARDRNPPTLLVCDATYVLDTTEGQWRIVSAELDVRGHVEGIDAAGFARSAEIAGETCVVSQALKGNVTISTRPRLEPG